MESIFGEKPPVDTVEKELHIESYKGKPAKYNNVISLKVKKKYKVQRRRAVCAI